MEERGEMVQIRDTSGPRRATSTLWQNAQPASASEERSRSATSCRLEGADSIVELSYLEKAYASGLRAIGPAHYGPGRYSPGTGASGGLTPAGRELVKEMRRLGIVLDVTHLTDEAFWEALDLYDGPVWASHNNCRALVPHQRQFNDDQLKELIRRDAVIGGRFRRLDDGPRLGPRQNNAARDRLQDSKRSSITSITSASSPATPPLSPSAPISTAATAPSKRRSTSIPSPICSA